ncbi:MAG TPA: NADH:ubiquinone oxidoreductase [Candidatus Wallbacteria bacterium]|nr:MAG: NAD-reducing hydrogenase HoxS subunit delta [bacterium ADurb.Bin243]HPG58435.1 NADH:ubiquinone oxidoreductase [Candidatus Wallbacteria bacterium]
MSKPKVAFFDFTSCEGCQLEVLNQEPQDMIDLLNAVEIVNFREAISDKGQDYDIAFIEGSISRPADETRIKKIRRQAKILVALGACACTGGLNAMKNKYSAADYKNYVYKDKAHYERLDTYAVRPVSAVVKVDCEIPGCPINRFEFLRIVKSVLMGVTPQLPDYPVCVECKMKDNVCMYQRGETCMGPVTRAGCDAICTSYGDPCTGCRGFVPHPNLNAQKDVLAKHGLSPEDVMLNFTMFNNFSKEDTTR